MMGCWLSLKTKHDLCISINLRTTSRINGYSNKAVEVPALQLTQIVVE